MSDKPKNNTECPEHLKQASLYSPEWTTVPVHDYRDDTVSGLLMPLRVQDSVVAFGTFERPWGFACAATNRFIHYTIAGLSAVLDIEHYGQYLLQSGDIVVLPHGSAHIIRDTETNRCVPLQLPSAPAGNGAFGQQVYRLDEQGRFFPESVETRSDSLVDGISTSISLAASSLQPGSAKALLKFLPPIIHVQGRDGMFLDWFVPLARLISLELEQSRPGGGAMIERLTEVFFMQAILAYFSQASSGSAGQGMLARSQGIRTILGAMHQYPEKPFTTESMAREAGMSRTAFADSFKKIVGEGPKTYLRQLRLERSAELLRSGLRVDDVATRVGYQSKPAFERAFKRQYQCSPAAYKKTL